MSRPRPHALPWLAGLLVWWLVLPAGYALAGVTAEVEPREVELGQSVVLRVLLDGEAPAAIDLTPLAAWTVIPRGRATGTRTEAGRVVPVAAYRFELSPRRAGELDIPPLGVTRDGRTAHTPVLRVTVRPRAAPPPELAGRDLVLDARVSTDAPFVGEPLRYTLRLYRLLAVETATITPPTFPGFAVIPLPGQRDGEVASGNRRYAVTEVAYQLTPRRAGRLPLGPGTAVCREVAPPDTSRGGRSRTVTGPEIVVTARPLPPFAGPGSFAGVLTGGSLAVRLETPGHGEGPDPVLAVTVTGQGDLASLGAPRLDLAQGGTARPLPSPTPDRNGRTFRFALAPTPPDSQRLPLALLTVFDPTQAAYVTLRARPEALEPTAGPGNPDPLPPLSPMPAEAAATPSWLAVVLGALIGPAGFLVLGFWPGRRFRQAEPVSATPAVLAEALRDLADVAQGDAAVAIRNALGRLDRLLYSGRDAAPDALEAALREARRLLAEKRP